MFFFSLFFLLHLVSHHQQSQFQVPIIQLHLYFNNNNFYTQMDPIYFPYCTYQPSDYSFFTIYEYPIHSFDYYHFNNTPSLSIQQDFNAYGFTQNKNYVTNTESVKVQQIENESKRFQNHENINFDENQKHLRPQIRDQIKVNQVDKINYPKSLKVKYFDPTQAPVMTSSRYYDVQNSIEPKITKKVESQINQLQFVQEDSCPFIIQRHKNIKKKYKIYLKKQKQDVVLDFEQIYSEMGSSDCFHHQRGQRDIKPQDGQRQEQSRRGYEQEEEREEGQMKKKSRTEINQNQIKCYKKQRKNEKFGINKRDLV